METSLREAVIKAKTGEREAFVELYNATNRMVYYTALKFTGNENDAQDLVQETYIKAFQSLGTLQEAEAFPGWLKTITANLCKNHLKKRKPLLFEDTGEQERVLENLPEIGEDFLPEEYVLKQDKSRLVMNIIDGLPDLQRTAVVLYYYDELPVVEIAAVMETNVGTIKSRLNYARQQIKSEVLKLEKKDTKLYGVTAMPLLAVLLHNDAAQHFLPEAAKQVILSKALATGAKTLAGAAKAAAPAASAAKGIFASSLAAKITASVVAVALVAGGAIGVNRVVRNARQHQSRAAYVSKLDNRELTDLLGLTRDEFISIFGEPGKAENMEFNERLTYNDSKGQSVMNVFVTDGEVNDIIFYTGDFNIRGVKPGDPFEKVGNVFNGEPDFTDDDIGWDKEGTLSLVSFDDGSYSYQFAYNHDKVKFISVSLIQAESNTEEALSRGVITSDILPETLLGKTGDEIIALLGEPYNSADGDYTYMDSNKDELTIGFDKEQKANSITYWGKLMPFAGLPVLVGEPVDEARRILSQNSDVERLEDGGAIDSSSMLDFYKDGYAYTLVSGKDNVVVKVIAGIWDKKAETDASHEAYKNYFISQYRMKNAQAVFADVTHDGKDEMLVVYGDGYHGYVDVVSFDSAMQGKVIYSDGCGITTNEMWYLRLYQAGGKAYLMRDGFFGRQGANLYSCEVFSLKQDGSPDYLYQKSLEGNYTDDDTSDDIPEAELDQYQTELTAFENKATTLVIPGEDGLEYAKGENFTAGPDGKNLIALDGLLLQDDMTFSAFLGRTDTSVGWERLYDGLEITSNEGAWDSFHMTSAAYSVCGIYVGMSKAEAVSRLDPYTNPQDNGSGVTLYVLNDRPETLPDAYYIVWMAYSGDIVTDIYYQVSFLDADYQGI